MRLFFALDLPRALKEALAASQVRYQALPLRATWTDPWKLHLTLAFLGEQPEDGLPPLRRVGEEVAGRHRQIPLRTSLLGGFPRSRGAHVLWLGLEANPALESFVADLREALLRWGLPQDPKPFAAHLTLARFLMPVDITALGPAPEAFVWEAQELVLYRSHLEPKGARYEKLGVFPFSG